MTEIRIDVPDGEVACRTAGAGSPVVLLHGGALDHGMWAPQLESLAADHLVIAPDARGHGASSTPTAPSRACDDVAAVLDAVAGGPAVLVGLSMGARVAVDTALEHPHLVRGLVVSGAGAGEPDFRDPFLLDMFAEQAGGCCALIEGSAHYPNLERPAQFDALLRDFLATDRGWRRAT